MGNLNKIAILFTIEKNRSLESLITEALDIWKRKKDTKELKAATIVFSDKQLAMTEESTLLGLGVEYRRDVQPNHFKIETVTQ